MEKIKEKMTQKQIKEFSKWIKSAEPFFDKDTTEDEYWELFAYRIIYHLEL